MYDKTTTATVIFQLWCMFVNFHNVGENYLSYEIEDLTGNNCDFIKVINILTQQIKSGQPYVTPLKKITRYFRTYQPRPRATPLAQARGRLRSRFGDSQGPHRKTAHVLGKVLTERSQQKWCPRKAAPLPPQNGLLKPALPAHGRQWNSLYWNFTHHVQWKNSRLQDRLPGMSHRARLRAHVHTRAWCC